MVRTLAAVAILSALAGSIAFAQSASEKEALASARREAQAALERSHRLDAQAKAATSEAQRARAESARLAARIEAAEAGITAAQTQVGMIERMRAEQRARLARRQEPVTRLVAALQTMGRRPPALALVQPGSLDNMVHVRALLASTLPVVRARTAALRGELAEADRLREQADKAVAGLRAGQQELRSERLALARFEAGQLRRSQTLAQSALFQSDRALALDEATRDLSSQFSARRQQEALQRELAKLPPPLPRPGRTEAPARPALAYRLPVEGRLVTGTGEISPGGVHSRGMTFEAAANAPITAPAGGRIAFAGPFRDYGIVVVIDHGNGWTSTITRLGRLETPQGARIRAGDRLGTTGSARGEVGVELRQDGRPVAIAPLLAGG